MEDYGLLTDPSFIYLNWDSHAGVHFDVLLKRVFVGRSTGNFAAGSAAGGGREVPRSAPATPLQLEPTPTPRNTKHEK